MSRIISTGIDIGTNYVKVVVVEYIRGQHGGIRKIIGTGSSESNGLRHGYIIDNQHVARAVRHAVLQAEKSSRVPVKSALVSLGGVGIEAYTTIGSAAVTRADGEITQLDIDRALAQCEHSLPDLAKVNRKIIHTIPITNKVDGKEVLGRITGMKAGKIEIKTLFVTALEQHCADLIEAVEQIGIEIEDVVVSPIAGAIATLSKAQRIAGCVLVDIGAETVSIIVYENDVPISLKIFPIGSSDITNDIALGLRVPLEDAEKLKLGGTLQTPHPRKKLEEIITARLKDIFELIEAHLKKMGRNGLLPAGVVLTGGGSRIATIEDLAKHSLALPSRIGKIEVNSTAHGEVYDPSWTVAYGLGLLGLTPGAASGRNIKELSKGFTALKGVSGKINDLIKKFLP